MQEQWLRNVLLETGVSPGEEFPRTSTGLFDIHLKDEKIISVVPAEQNREMLEGFDAAGMLALPPLSDMHIHIDKTFYGGPWRAPRPASNGVRSRIAEELKLMPELLPTLKARANKMLDLYSGNGATFIRTHVNVDPAIETQNMERTLEVVAENAYRFDFEVVAFPQHGLLRSDSIGRMDAALSLGATHVGGVDPATIDLDIDKSLRTIFDLALKHDASVDLHLHDGGHLGLFTVRRLADLTRANGYTGRVTISHALGLADLSEQELGSLAEELVELKIDITSTVPIDRNAIPIPFLRAQGVNVWLGDDSITDHWSPFGKGDPLGKAGTLAERFRHALFTEEGLRSCLSHVTRGITPLNSAGQQIWPKIGDPASLLLLDASCSAEAVARCSPKRALFHRGQVVWSDMTNRSTGQI